MTSQQQYDLNKRTHGVYHNKHSKIFIDGGNLAMEQYGSGTHPQGATGLLTSLMFLAVLLSACATSPDPGPANRVVRAGEAGQAIILGQLTPIGTVISYAGSISDSSRAALASQGWLLCDGTRLSRTEFPELYSVLGVVHGQGDARRTFSLPDYRGMFLRGVSGNSGRDPQSDSRQMPQPGGNEGNRVGSVQNDTVGMHQHVEVGSYEQDSVNKVIGSVDPTPGMLQTQRAAKPSIEESRETRPKNAYVHYLIFSGVNTASAK